MMSAQIKLSSPPDKVCRCEGPAAVPIQPGANRAQSLPGRVLAGLAFHRCCQVAPEKVSSHCKIWRAPRIRARWCLTSVGRKGGCCRRARMSACVPAVAAQSSAAGLGANRPPVAVEPARRTWPVGHGVLERVRSPRPGRPADRAVSSTGVHGRAPTARRSVASSDPSPADRRRCVEDRGESSLYRASCWPG